jgi:hypothetical protein
VWGNNKWHQWKSKDLQICFVPRKDQTKSSGLVERGRTDVSVPNKDKVFQRSASTSFIMKTLRYFPSYSSRRLPGKCLDNYFPFIFSTLNVEILKRSFQRFQPFNDCFSVYPGCFKDFLERNFAWIIFTKPVTTLNVFNDRRFVRWSLDWYSLMIPLSYVFHRFFV